MTDEEINRKFDVVAEHLAALAVGLQGLQETQRRAEARWERTEGSIRALLATAELQAGEIKDLSAAVQTLDERTRHTDARLDALINTVERYFAFTKPQRRFLSSAGGSQDWSINRRVVSSHRTFVRRLRTPTIADG